ncbi:MAG: CCA tRNA nucleotidyltransferase [bacterium]
MTINIKKYSFIQKIIDAGGVPYLVGGCVRDQLLQRAIKDFDIVVRLIDLPDLIAVLKTCGHYNQVGKAFGVIKFIPKENPELEIDVALPRKEFSTGLGHKDFQVQSDPTLSLDIDLGRRDFTINAMARSLQDDDLVDPYLGAQDLKQKLIKTVFPNSFVEDPLRMLRAVQFAARFDFTIDPQTQEEMKQHAALIKTVSPERIVIEINKLFDAKTPSTGFHIMRDTELLPLVFPDIERLIGVKQPKKENEDVFDHTMRVLDATQNAEEIETIGDKQLMYTALFHDTGKPKTRREDEKTGDISFYNHQLISAGIAGRWFREYKATSAGISPKKICHLIKHHMFETTHFNNNDKALRRFISKVGVKNIFDLIDFRIADKKGGRFPKKVYGILQLRENIRKEMAKKPPFTGKDLALNGHDIMELGFTAGPIIGDIQRFLVDKVLDDPELNTKEGLARLIEENKSQFCD